MITAHFRLICHTGYTGSSPHPSESSSLAALLLKLIRPGPDFDGARGTAIVVASAPRHLEAHCWFASPSTRKVFPSSPAVFLLVLLLCAGSRCHGNHPRCVPAGHISTREWVQGPGSACRALSQLQPASLQVANSSRNISSQLPGNVESAVSWLVCSPIRNLANIANQAAPTAPHCRFPSACHAGAPLGRCFQRGLQTVSHGRPAPGGAHCTLVCGVSRICYAGRAANMGGLLPLCMHGSGGTDSMSQRPVQHACRAALHGRALSGVRGMLLMGTS